MRGSITLAVLVTLVAGRSPAAEPDAAAVAFFEKQVRPLLVEHCHGCHSAMAKKTRGGLALDSRDAILAGGETGPAVVPGKPEDSVLLHRLRGDDPDEDIMPPSGKLPDEQIAAIEKWIRDGAVWVEP